MTDFLGEDLEVGDLVAISHTKYQDFVYALVMKVPTKEDASRVGVIDIDSMHTPSHAKVKYKSAKGIIRIKHSQLTESLKKPLNKYIKTLPLETYMAILKKIKDRK